MRQSELTAIVDMLVADYGLELKTQDDRDDLECAIERAVMDAPETDDEEE